MPKIQESESDITFKKQVNQEIKKLQDAGNTKFFKFENSKSVMVKNDKLVSTPAFLEVINLSEQMRTDSVGVSKKVQADKAKQEEYENLGCIDCSDKEKVEYKYKLEKDSVGNKIVTSISKLLGGVDAEAAGLNNGAGLVIYSNVNSDYALDLANGNMTSGTRLAVWWRRPPIFGDNRIKAVKNNWNEAEFCLNSPYGLTTTTFSELTLYECGGDGNNQYQFWVVGKNTDFGQQYYNIIFSDDRSGCGGSWISSIGCHSWTAIYDQNVNPVNAFGMWSQQTDSNNSNTIGKVNNIKSGNNIHVDGGSGQVNVDDFMFSQDAFNPSYYAAINNAGVRYRAEFIEKRLADKIRYMNNFQTGGSSSSEPGWYKTYDLWGGKQCSTYAYTLWNYHMDSSKDISMSPFVPITPKTLSDALPYVLT